MDKSNGQGKRPTSAAQGVATRKAIIEAAGQLIVEVGWGQVTTRAIAARAGVPHGAVGYHFTGKVELLREAGMTATEQALAVPLTMALQADSVRVLLEGTAAWFAGGGLSDPSAALLLEVAREAMHDDALREHIAALLETYRTALTDLVANDQARGVVFGAATPAGTATVIAALLDGLLMHHLLDPALDVRASADAMLALVGGRQ